MPEVKEETFCTLMHEYNKSNFVLIYLFSCFV